MRMRLLCSTAMVLVATVVGLSPRSSASEDAPLAYFDCGRDIIHTEFVSDLPAGLKPQANRGAGGPQTFSIVLNVGPGLAAAPEALAAFQRAARIWESFFHDPVTVVIDAEFMPLGPNILGFARSRQFNTDYSTLRDAMVADAQADESVLASLPEVSGYDVILPEGFAFVGELRASKALLRALGFDMSFDDPNTDATIGFSSEFAFDFDPSDGISGLSFDFEGVALQEIGHALGFISGVDSVDRQLREDCQPTFGGPNTSVRLEPLDLFRLRPGDAESDFMGSPRIGAPGDFEPVQKFFDGFTELGLSTGANFGDARQASHWKANELSGVYLGVMDPTAGRGERLVVTDNDVRAFGLLGWDLVPDCNQNDVPDDQDIADGTSQDCNGNGVPDECDVDCNGNGTPDACENFTDCNGNNVPDECDTDCNGNGTPDDCDGFADCNCNNTPDENDTDCNANGTPDDCEAFADCNGNAVPDECELAGNDCDGNGTPDECDPDCNANGTPDACEQFPDCNFNGVPDECETDCNNNGTPDDCEFGGDDCNNNNVPDECDPDCNANGIPDDCESFDDCDKNGVPDQCDPDCNENGTPDACEAFADCNCNRIPDECDADCNGDGTPDNCAPMDDCNGSGVPDECELDQNDCNGNGIPDDCDTDCNENGTPDDCENFVDCNASGIPDDCELIENDCNANGTPDECDVAAGDCNGNGLPDDCELLEGDCNGNGVPDECDLAAGTSPDCQPNGVPDECDVSSGSSPDLNADGIPDECCERNADCDDGNVLTFDQCTGSACSIVPTGYGDLAGPEGVCGPDGSVGLTDLLAVLNGFAGDFAESCEQVNIDIAGPEGSCTADGTVDLNDILAVLDAFAGAPNCHP